MNDPPSDPEQPPAPPQTPPGRTVAFWVGVSISCLLVGFAWYAAALPVGVAGLILGLILRFQPRTRNFGDGLLGGLIPGFFLFAAFFWGPAPIVMIIWPLFAFSLLFIAVSSTRIKPVETDQSYAKGILVGMAPLWLMILFGDSHRSSLLSPGDGLWFLTTFILLGLGVVGAGSPRDRKFAHGLLLGVLFSILLGIPTCLFH